jgi:hypothetical protein
VLRQICGKLHQSNECMLQINAPVARRSMSKSNAVNWLTKHILVPSISATHQGVCISFADAGRHSNLEQMQRHTISQIVVAVSMWYAPHEQLCVFAPHGWRPSASASVLWHAAYVSSMCTGSMCSLCNVGAVPRCFTTIVLLAPLHVFDGSTSRNFRLTIKWQMANPKHLT